MNKTPRLHVDVYLAAGELGVYRRSLYVKTVLGSCVALCLWDGAARVAGINHFLLPTAPRAELDDLRFGSVSCSRLLERMRQAGAELRRLRVALIGGGSPTGGASDESVGAANARAALRVLNRHGLVVHRQETGGSYGRKLLFNTGTGALAVHLLGRAAAPLTTVRF